jgi:hypothetical protein
VEKSNLRVVEDGPFEALTTRRPEPAPAPTAAAAAERVVDSSPRELLENSTPAVMHGQPVSREQAKAAALERWNANRSIRAGRAPPVARSRRTWRASRSGAPSECSARNARRRPAALHSSGRRTTKR